MSSFEGRTLEVAGLTFVPFQRLQVHLLRNGLHAASSPLARSTHYRCPAAQYLTRPLHNASSTTPQLDVSSAAELRMRLYPQLSSIIAVELSTTAANMSSTSTIRLSHRSPKQPLKRLPPSVELPASATLEDLKRQVAKQAGVADFNRIGLFDPATRKTLKDRHARVPASGSELLVKDLGPQIAWRTVFLVEYVGPLIVHAGVIAARPWLYTGGEGALSATQRLTFALIVGHFVKRELETLFVHKFSANTMPAANIFKNCFFYWAIAGLLCASSIYSPRSRAAQADFGIVDALGTALYLFGQAGNALVHLYLSSLRSAGGTERKIPAGYGFGLVTCPNYMYEVLSWTGMILVSRDWTVVLFITLGAAQMFAWARGKESAYRKEFGDKYKKKRYVMLPGLL